MARLYANENFPLPVVEALRQLGHDVLTVREAGEAGQAVPDDEVLAFAKDDGRALLTLNRKHFVRLHEEQTRHAGIIACTFDADFERQLNGYTRPSRRNPNRRAGGYGIGRGPSGTRPFLVRVEVSGELVEERASKVSSRCALRGSGARRASRCAVPRGSLGL